MTRNPCSQSGYFRRDGVALVATLGVIVVLAAVIVSLTLAMRLDRQAAHYFTERTRADMLALEGVESVRAIVQHATAPGNFWVSSPGSLLSTATADFSEAAVTLLFSGAAAPTDDSFPDLDRAVISDDLLPALTGSASGHTPLRVGWVYVRKNGERELIAVGTPDTSDSDNPIIGRFAFWADDETARINLNTAWKNTASPTAAASHPSRINLTTLPGIEEEVADAIRGAAQAFAFGSPDGARRVSPAAAEAVSDNRFSLTHYSASPLENPWGEPKIYLTTRESRLPPEIAAQANRSEYFIDILQNPSNDPGDLASLNTGKVTSVLNRLRGLLARQDWPYAGGSFRDKYGDANTLQMAIDIIEYVRAAESARPVVEPLRLQPTGASSYTFSGSGVTTPGVMIGNSRRPMLTEVGAWISAPVPSESGGHPSLDFVYKAEFYFPNSYGLSAETLLGRRLDITVYYLKAPGSSGVPYLDMSAAIDPISAANTEFTQTENGTFAVVTGRKTFTHSALTAQRPSEIYMRVVLQRGGNVGVQSPGFGFSFWELAPASLEDVADLGWINTYLRIDVPSVPEASPETMTTLQVADPRINKRREDWVQRPNTLGDVNGTLWLSEVASPAGQPPQDRSGSGQISDASLALPAPNPNGSVQSIAELGNLPTGIRTEPNPVPWRSLRLQPTPSGAQSPPDWALLDLFAVPPLATAAGAMESSPSSAGVRRGGINLNAGIEPFGDSVLRDVPLRALFESVPNPSPAFVEQAVESIQTRRPSASNGRRYGPEEFLVSVGELTELQNIADQGEESERNLDGIVDLATVQGSAYRVAAIGQTLTQTPTGDLVLQAESSISATIERTPDGGTRVVHWKSVPQ